MKHRPHHHHFPDERAHWLDDPWAHVALFILLIGVITLGAYILLGSNP